MDVGTKNPLFEVVLQEPGVMISKEPAPSILERHNSAHTFKKANEDMYGTLVESESDATDYKLPPLSKSVVEPPYETRSELYREFADLCVVN